MEKSPSRQKAQADSSDFPVHRSISEDAEPLPSLHTPLTQKTVLQLQRLVGNQATQRLSVQLRAAYHLPIQRKTPARMVRTVQDADEGYGVLEAIQRGEPPTWIVEAATEDSREVNAIEWGLGRGTDDAEKPAFFIVKGGGKDVEWDTRSHKLGGVTPMAHTHPLKDRQITNKCSLKAMLDPGQQGDTFLERMKIFPSVDDLTGAANAFGTEKQQTHRIYTPYVGVEAEDDFILQNPSEGLIEGPQEQYLSFELHNIYGSITEKPMDNRAMMRVYVGTREVADVHVEPVPSGKAPLKVASSRVLPSQVLSANITTTTTNVPQSNTNTPEEGLEEKAPLETEREGDDGNQLTTPAAAISNSSKSKKSSFFGSLFGGKEKKKKESKQEPKQETKEKSKKESKKEPKKETDEKSEG